MDGYQRLASLGPFFALAELDRVAGSDESDWRPLRTLTTSDVLDERVRHTHAVLTRMSGSAVDERVAASTMSLGLFARLISPSLGSAVIGVDLPAPSLDAYRWQPTDGGPWPLGIVGTPEPVDVGAVITVVIEPLADALADQYALSRQILLGNAASAVFGAVTMVGASRPDLLADARRVAEGVLAHELVGAGHVNGRFVRASCCLYYRIPGGGYCGDCVLAHR